MAYITINKDNYFYNLNKCLKRVKSINELILVLKDNAYGHGVDEISLLALEFGINYVAVKNQVEASKISDKFNNILILSQIAKHYEAKPNYILAINDLSYFNYISKNDKIALKLDSGMHRSGLGLDDLKIAIKIIKDKNLNLISAFTHYSSPANIKNQMPLYLQMCELIKSSFDHEIFFHSANSSTLFMGENKSDNAARIGLAQFGYCDTYDELKPVLSLYAEKISQRKIKKDDSIGYDEVYKANEDLVVSNYDLGYADGLMYYKGLNDLKFADINVLGKFSMDSFSANYTNETICVFNNAKTIAKHFNTSVYEILVRLNANISKHII